MRDNQRDPYATPPTPRDRSGPMLRLAIVAALLVAAVWAYMTYSQGPGLTQAAADMQQPAEVANARATRGYGLAPAEIPEAAPPPETPSAAAAPSAEPVPPPSTTTVPPA